MLSQRSTQGCKHAVGKSVMQNWMKPVSSLSLFVALQTVMQQANT